jgi:hypothetical protein
MDSKNTYLKNIIREEIQLAKEQIMDPVEYEKQKEKAGPNPFNNHQPTADAFRNWLNANETSYVKSNGITKTGSLSDPKLIKAFETYKKKYWTYLNNKKGTSTPSKGKGAVGAAVKAAGDLLKSKGSETPTSAENPFKNNQGTANAFRNWMYQAQYAYVMKNNIAKTGPATDPNLIKAYEKYKKTYWTYIKDRKEKIAANEPLSTMNFTVFGLNASQLTMLGIGAWIAWALGSKIFMWRSLKKMKTKLSETQAMTIASDPSKFKNAVSQSAKANPKALKKELQTLNPDVVIPDEEVVALQKALGNPRLTVDILIQARRTVLQSFKNAIANGKLPKYNAEKVINTLTPSEREKYANVIRDMYAKAQKKKQFNAKVKRTWNKVRDKFPYGD